MIGGHDFAVTRAAVFGGPSSIGYAGNHTGGRCHDANAGDHRGGGDGDSGAEGRRGKFRYRQPAGPESKQQLKEEAADTRMITRTATMRALSCSPAD